AAFLFDGDVTRIGHEETKRLLIRDEDQARPLPDVTFSDSYTLEVGGEQVELAWHGPNHSPDNIYIHFPDHDTLMFIDVVNAGWIAIYNLNLSDDVIGYTGARPSRWTTRGRTSSAGTWAGWQPERTSRCTSSTSPTSKPAHARRWPRSTRDRFSSTTAITYGQRPGPTSTPSPSTRPPPSSRNTPVCWAVPTSRSSPRPSRSCSRFASTVAQRPGPSLTQCTRTILPWCTAMRISCSSRLGPRDLLAETVMCAAPR